MKSRETPCAKKKKIHCRTTISSSPSALVLRGDNCRHNNDEDENDDASDEAHAHLHVLPPHLLANPVRTTTESLSRDSQVVGLILEGIETLATLRNLVDVVTHHTDGVINLRLESLSPGIASRLLLLGRGITTAGDVGVVGSLFRHLDG